MDRFVIVAKEDAAIGEGVSWLVEYATKNGLTRARVYVDGLDDARELPAPLTALGHHRRDRRRVDIDGVQIGLSTRREPDRLTDAVVLAVWPSDPALVNVERHHPAALAVVHPAAAGLTWTKAHSPIDLRSQVAVGDAPTIANPVVLTALKSLTQTLAARGLVDRRDRDTAVDALRRLHKGGEQFTAQEIETWTAGNGWRADQAHAFGELAKQVLAGHRLRAAQRLRPDILDVWRASAADPGTT